MPVKLVVLDPVMTKAELDNKDGVTPALYRISHPEMVVDPLEIAEPVNVLTVMACHDKLGSVPMLNLRLTVSGTNSYASRGHLC